MEKLWHGRELNLGPSSVMKDALTSELPHYADNIVIFWLMTPDTLSLLGFPYVLIN